VKLGFSFIAPHVGDDGKGEEEPAPEPKRRGKKAAEPGQAQREANRSRACGGDLDPIILPCSSVNQCG
jgi:hypothetical protein